MGLTEFYLVLVVFSCFHYFLKKILLVSNGFNWDLLSFTGFYWVLPSSSGFLPSVTGFYLVLLDFTEFC